MNLSNTVTEVSLFSDTYGGQNRNQNIAALLLYIVQTTNIEVIEQKFRAFNDGMWKHA